MSKKFVLTKKITKGVLAIGLLSLFVGLVFYIFSLTNIYSVAGHNCVADTSSCVGVEKNMPVINWGVRLIVAGIITSVVSALLLDWLKSPSREERKN